MTKWKYDKVNVKYCTSGDITRDHVVMVIVVVVLCLLIWFK